MIKRILQIKSGCYKFNIDKDRKSCIKSTYTCMYALCMYVCMYLCKYICMYACDGPGFNSRSEQCIYRASRPSQGTVNGGAVSK